MGRASGENTVRITPNVTAMHAPYFCRDAQSSMLAALAGWTSASRVPQPKITINIPMIAKKCAEDAVGEAESNVSSNDGAIS